MKILFLLLSCFAFCSCDYGIYFNGIVTNADGVPLSGVSVSAYNRTYLTDSVGKFEVFRTEGRPVKNDNLYEFVVAKDGFVSDTVYLKAFKTDTIKMRSVK